MVGVFILRTDDFLVVIVWDLTCHRRFEMTIAKWHATSSCSLSSRPWLSLWPGSIVLTFAAIIIRGVIVNMWRCRSELWTSTMMPVRGRVVVCVRSVQVVVLILPRPIDRRVPDTGRTAKAAVDKRCFATVMGVLCRHSLKMGPMWPAN